MRLLVDNDFTQIEGAFPTQAIYNATSYMVEGAWFSQAYKKGFWDGRVKFLKYNRSTKQYYFPTGFLSRVTKALDEIDTPYTLEDDRLIDPPELQHILLDDFGRPTVDLSVGKWSYQADIARRFLSHGRGIVSIPTGGGKTEIGAAIIKSIGTQTAWLTHRRNLMYQTQERLSRRLGVPVGMYGDGNKDIQEITVVMVQSAALSQNENKADLHQFLTTCQLVVGDEIHHLESDQWFENFAKLKAPWRLGLTATPRLTGPGLALIGMVGDIVAKVDLIDLIERKVLVIPRIWFLPIKEPLLPKKTPWQTAYAQGVVQSKRRNEAICQVAATFKREGKPTITLVQRINHGELLTDMLCYSGIRAAFIKGAVEQSERDSILEKLKDGRLDNVVAVASIMGEGTDLPFLRAMINATGTKGGGNTEDGETGRATLQFLGRIIRNFPGKSHADYVDVADLTHPHLIAASKARVATLQDQGYLPFIKYWQDYDFA
jgi:superfamily II DNA or RNA helicase